MPRPSKRQLATRAVAAAQQPKKLRIGGPRESLTFTIFSYYLDRLPTSLPPGVKPHVLVTSDESTFNTNDRKRKLWMPKGEQPIRSKGKGKGIMVFDLITTGGRLVVPLSVSDKQLAEPERGLSGRYTGYYHEYSKDNYWTSEKLVDHTVKIAMPIYFPRSLSGLYSRICF